jgi:hypothetical protein
MRDALARDQRPKPQRRPQSANRVLETLQQGLAAFDAKTLLRKKNPALYATRGARDPRELARQLVNDWSTSSEETKFGKVFEALANLLPTVDVAGVSGFDVKRKRPHQTMTSWYAITSGPSVYNDPSKSAQGRAARSLTARLRGDKAWPADLVVGFCLRSDAASNPVKHAPCCRQGVVD